MQGCGCEVCYFTLCSLPGGDVVLVPIPFHVRDADQADGSDDSRIRWPWWSSVDIDRCRDVDVHTFCRDSESAFVPEAYISVALRSGLGLGYHTLYLLQCKRLFATLWASVNIDIGRYDWVEIAQTFPAVTDLIPRPPIPICHNLCLYT